MYPWSYSPLNPCVGTPTLPRGATTMPTLPKLFQPLKLRSVTLKNRIGVSPMCMYSCKDGFTNDFHLVHYGQFALGGAALVITEASAVQPNGRISPHDAGIWSDDHIAGYRDIVDFCHNHNTVAGIQLAHAGRKASLFSPFLAQRGPGARPWCKVEEGGWPDNVVGPSPIPWGPGWLTPHELTKTEIKQIIDDFVAGAKRALTAGFDLIELHGAHGYLLHSFLSPLSNQRTDEYGGSFENRIRFCIELVTAVRKVWPEHLPLFVRLSCSDWTEGGWDSEQTVQLVERLLPLGVDVVDCSSGGQNENQKIPIGPGYQVPFSIDIKAKHKSLTAAIGMITDGKQAEKILQDGSADLIFAAREFLRDPHFPMRAMRELGVRNIAFAPQYSRSKL